MSVPNSIADLSVTPSGNAPAGSEALSGADDFLRTLSAFIRQMVSSGSDIASATTITPDAVASSYNVTGTTAITTIASTNSWNGRLILLRFAGALTFTHGSNLNLPGAANITTAAGDVALVRQRTSGTWDCVIYQKASGLATVASLTALDSNWSFASGVMKNGGGTQPMFRASRGAIQISGATIIFDVENTNRGSIYNVTTGIMTVPADMGGAWRFSATGALVSAASVMPIARNINLCVGATPKSTFTIYIPQPAQSNSFTLSTDIELSAADQVSVKTSVAFDDTDCFLSGSLATFSGYFLG